jgi:hypothetical protein
VIHFSPEGWFDFARGTVPPDQRALMQRHLDEHCHQCFKVSETWRTILEITCREVAYCPRASALQLVKAAFVSENPLG